MERRTLLAFLLCFILIWVWQATFAPRRRPPPASKDTAQGRAQPREEARPEKRAEAPPPAPEKPAEEAPAPPVPEGFEEKRSVLGNDLLEAVVSNVDGGIVSVRLEKYVTEPGGDEKLRLFDALPDVEPALAVHLVIEGKPVPLRAWGVVEEAGDRVVYRLRHTDPALGDLEIEKTIRIAPGRYHLDVGVAVRNLGSERRSVRYEVLGSPGIVSEHMRPGSDLAAAFGIYTSSGAVHVRRISIGKTDPEPVRYSVAFGALMGNYFAAIVRPMAPGGGEPTHIAEGGVAFGADPFALRQRLEALARERGIPLEEIPREEREKVAKKVYRSGRVRIVTKAIRLDPGARVAHGYQFFAGPKDPRILRDYDEANYRDLVRYGWSWIAPLTRLFVWLLALFRSITTSYGIGIILLTVLVKVLLHPVNRKNQAAMQRYQQKMQKIQPEINRIKERYKNNRMKMNREMQRVMKEHNVQPQQMLGGCLLMLLQFPVWIALIGTFRSSIDLRQASFLWIDDLTRPDRLFPLGASLPLLGGYFNLLPVLYMMTTIVQMKLQPKPKDQQAAQQQKMMAFMMVFLGVIFYNFSAGLLLYFLTSAVLGIGESHLIRRELAKARA